MRVQQLSTGECHKQLLDASFGRLACAFENQPYVVPIYFVVDPAQVQDLYLFSMPGHKIEWMRANPLVCVQVDAVHGRSDWTSIIAFGHYEELPDTPTFALQRQHALGLLQTRKMWWEPGAVGVTGRQDDAEVMPVYYRIHIDRMTGHRAHPAGTDKRLVERPTRTFKSWIRSIFTATS